MQGEGGPEEGRQVGGGGGRPNGTQGGRLLSGGGGSRGEAGGAGILADSLLAIVEAPAKNITKSKKEKNATFKDMY